MRSGPTKGYTEALEHRLEATEDALMRLLALADMDSISSAFRHQDSNDRVSGTSESHYMARSAEDKASLMAQWDDYPLGTAEDLQRWATIRLGTINLRAVREGGPDDDEEETPVGEITNRCIAQAPPNPSHLTPSIEPVSHFNDVPQQFREQFIW